MRKPKHVIEIVLPYSQTFQNTKKYYDFAITSLSYTFFPIVSTIQIIRPIVHRTFTSERFTERSRIDPQLGLKGNAC